MGKPRVGLTERVLITGGAGFIGRALVATCLRGGHRVTVIDNLCAGRLENLKPFLDDIDFHECDVLDQPRIREIMASSRPGIVFHLAAHHFIPLCDEHPNETLRVNVEGTHVVLSEAVPYSGVVVVASSGAFYPSREAPLSEDLEAAPGDVYGLSKQMAEMVTQFIANNTSMACVAARLFNTYGPYETNPHLIPHIVDSLKRGPMVSLGNIHTKRDYIYVEDVGDLLHRCAVSGHQGYAVVNIGTGEEYSASQIVEAVGLLLGRDIEIVIDPSRVREVDKLHQRADTERLKELTGLLPRHSLIDGLQKLLTHEGLMSAASKVCP